MIGEHDRLIDRLAQTAREHCRDDRAVRVDHVKVHGRELRHGGRGKRIPCAVAGHFCCVDARIAHDGERVIVHNARILRRCDGAQSLGLGEDFRVVHHGVCHAVHDRREGIVHQADIQPPAAVRTAAALRGTLAREQRRGGTRRSSLPGELARGRFGNRRGERLAAAGKPEQRVRREDLPGIDALALRRRFEQRHGEIDVIALFRAEPLGERGELLFAERPQTDALPGRDGVREEGESLRLVPIAVHIVFRAAEPVEKALRVVVSGAQVFPALRRFKFQRAAEIGGRLNGKDARIRRDLHRTLHADAEEPQRENVLVAVLDEHMQRQHVAQTAVGVALAAELFAAEHRQIGAREQHVAERALRQILCAQLEQLPVRKGEGVDEKLRGRFAHRFLVHDLRDPLAQRRNVKAAFFHDLEHLQRHVVQLVELHVALQKARHRFVVHIHDLRIADVFPDGLRFFQIAHHDERAVESADGGARDGVDLYARLAQRLPGADLVCALRPAAFKRQRVGTGYVNA